MTSGTLRSMRLVILMDTHFGKFSDNAGGDLLIVSLYEETFWRS